MRLAAVVRQLGAIAVSLISLSAVAFGATPTKSAVVTGNWSDGSIWSPAGVPGPADIVQIGAAANVTYDLASSTIAHLQTEPGAVQTINLIMSTGTTLNVTGAIEWGDTSIGNNVTLILNVASTVKAGSLAIAGPTGGAISQVSIGNALLDIDGNVTFNGGVPLTRITYTSNGLMKVGGNFGPGGTLTTVTGSTAEFDGAAAQAIGPGYTFSNVIVNKPAGQTATFGSSTNINTNLTINGGNVSDGGSQLNTSGVGILTMLGGTQLHIGSPAVASSTTLPAFGTYALDPVSEIIFRANATQAIRSEPTYGILALETGTNSVVKTTATSAAMTIQTALKFITSPAAITFSAAANNTPITVKDVLGLTGTLTMGTGTGDLTVTGTYSSGGTLNVTNTDVFYTSPGAAIVKNATYGTLTLSGGGTYAVKANTISNFGLSLNGILNIDPGVTLRIDGDLNVFGGNVINGAGATLALRAIGQVSNTTLLTIQPDVSVQGTRALNTDIAASGVWTIESTTTLTNNANFASTAAGGVNGVALDSNWIQGSASSAAVFGPFMTVGLLDATAGPNLVTYNGPGAQGVTATSYHDLDIAGGGTKTTSGPINVSSDLTISGGSATLSITSVANVMGDIVIGAGTSLNGNGSAITLAGNWSNSGTFNEGTSTVVFNNSTQVQNISSSTFHNFSTSGPMPHQVMGDLLISGNAIIDQLDGGSSTITVGGAWSVSGWFYSGTSHVILNSVSPQNIASALGAFYDVDFLGGDKTLTTNLGVVGDLVIGSGTTLNAGANSLLILGSFLNNGTFNAGTSSVQLGQVSGGAKIKPSALGIVSIGGSSPTTFNNLEIDTLGTVPQNASTVTVNGLLELTSGEYVTGANLLVVGPAGSVSRTSGYVFGNLQQSVTAPSAVIYHMGSLGDYTPVNINVNSGSGALTVSTFGTPHPNAANAAGVLQRYWQLQGTGFDLTPQFSYVDSTVMGVEANYVVGHYGGSWSYPPSTLDTAGNTFTVTSTAASGTFTIGEPLALSGAATQFTITAASSMSAGATNSLTITARDASGNVVPSYAGDQLLTFSGAAVSGSGSAPTISDKTGAAVAFGTPLTLTFTAGVATVSGGTNGVMTLYAAETANITATATGINTPTPLTVTVNAGALNNFAFAIASPQNNGQPFTGTNTLTARDVYFNTVTTFNAALDPVSVAASGVSGVISGLGSGNNATLNQAGDFVSGVANLTAQGIRYDGTTGTATLTATSSTAITGTSNSFLINAGTATLIQILLPGETNTPGSGKSGTPAMQTSGAPFTITINLLDANFNLAAPGGTTTVTLSSSDGAATLPAPIAMSGNSTTTSITLATSGSQTVTASATVNASPQTDASNVLVAAGALAQFLVEQSGGGAIAPQIAGTPFNIQITAQDASGNTVTSFNGTVQLTSTPGLAGEPVTSSVFTAGVLAAQPVTINSASTNATITATNGATGTSAPFIVNAAGTGSFSVTAVGGGAIGTQTAGTPFNVEIMALDSFGNVNPTYAGTVTLTTTAGAITPTSVTFVAGDLGSKIVSVVVTGAGTSEIITANDASLPAAGASAPFDVVHGPLALFFIEDAAGGPIPDQLVLTPFSIRIVAKDNYSNIVTSFNGTADITSNGPLSLGDGTTAAFVNGVLSSHTVEFFTSGFFNITATKTGGTESGTSDEINVLASCLTSFNVISPANGATNVAANVVFYWEGVPGATYKLYYGLNGATPQLMTSTPGISFQANVGIATVSWYVEAISSGCPNIVTPLATFTTWTGCAVPATPLAASVGEVTSGEKYTVEWSMVSGATSYQIQEATSSDFIGAVSQVVVGNKASFQHATTTPVPYFYRVRAVADCNGGSGAFSKTVRTVIVPPPSSTQPNPDVTTPLGSDKVIVQQIFIPGEPAGIQPNGIRAMENKSFVASSDRSWMTVTPAAGTIPPSGTTLTVRADPKDLPVGTNTGTINVVATSGQPVTNVPVSINIVTPVTPSAKNSAVPGTLIIPSVGHLSGLNSQWQSDIRITNLSALKQKYRLSFTPSNVDGTAEGKQTTIEIAGGDTTALDDIVKRWYGLGSLGDGANGVLEIRPFAGNGKTLPVDLGKVTVASSRTYNVTPKGTLGQYIPAIPYEQFAGRTDGRSTKLSLQQIAQSELFRTNIGLVEAGGEPAEVKLTFFDASNNRVFELPVSLKPAEHQQLNNILGQNNVVLADGRVEIDVLSATGKVTAYASVVDNRTNDPLLVSAQPLPAPAADRYVVPGVAAIDTDQAKWRTDMRVFNTSSSPQTTTITFYPEGNPGAATSREVTMGAGAITQFDDIVKQLFGTANGGGSVAISTSNSTPLVVTARTYNRTDEGTFGQYIPAVTAAQAVGIGSVSGLSILQIEESARFRTNVGIAEVTGKAATVELTVIDSSLKIAPTMRITLQPNEFRQINAIAKQLNIGNTYNARVDVHVVGGEGKVTAYGSVVDNQTQDPTYVPAQ